ncbi:MAG: hypothetical protein H0X66_04245 [Verrucomicrobia bacterium]|nr:hypothetical protein [Verrucomicrobiota bacterium]
MTERTKEKPFTLHPFMLGALLLLICYRELAPHVKPLEFLTLLAGFAAAIAVIHLAATRFFSSRIRGGFATSLAVLFFGFAAEMRTSIEWALDQIFTFEYIDGIYVMAALPLVWIILLRLLYRTKFDLARISRFISVISLVVVVATVFEVYTVTARRKVAATPRKSHAPLMLPTNPPDIYFILMDAYTSAESLKTHWDYDNSPFVEFLSGKSFDVVENARANYDYTPYCLAAYLGMEHPANVPEFGHWPKMNYLTEIVRNAEAPGRLKASGYEILNYSIFDVAGEKRLYRCPTIESISVGGLAFTKSILGLLVEREKLSFRDVNLQLFSTLPKLAAERGTKPRFIYAHVMMPHSPYLFDEHGNHVVRGMTIYNHKKEDYLEHLIFANRMLTNTISEILENSAQPPIIILQGDHGFRSLKGKARVAEALTILNAYHLPEARKDWVYEGITPVNSFRMIFNHYFGENYSYAPDTIHSVISLPDDKPK